MTSTNPNSKGEDTSSTENTTTFRFKKNQRLLKPDEFSHVFDKTERKVHATHIMGFVRKNNLDHPRLGLAITKKKVPTAVSRNQLKRLSRENFRLMAPKLANQDIVIIAKRPIKGLSNHQLNEEIQQLLKKLHKTKK